MSLEAARLLLGSLPLLTETKTNKQEVGFPLTFILGEIIILLNSANLGEDRRATMYRILSYDKIKQTETPCFIPTGKQMYTSPHNQCKCA